MMNIPKKIYKTGFWLALAVLFIVSSIPEIPVQTSAQNNGTTFRYDYLFHFLAYAAIGFLYFKSYMPKVSGFLLIIGYAALEEVHQHWIPGRTLNPVDFGFDVAGLLVALLVFLLTQRKWQKILYGSM